MECVDKLSWERAAMARLRKHSNWTVKGPDVKLSLCMALAEAVTPRTEEIRS